MVDGWWLDGRRGPAPPLSAPPPHALPALLFRSGVDPADGAVLGAEIGGCDSGDVFRGYRAQPGDVLFQVGPVAQLVEVEQGRGLARHAFAPVREERFGLPEDP